jgi:hypothetical protein
MIKWAFILVFSCFGIINAYSQTNGHIQLNVFTGHMTNLWDRLEEYDRENLGLNPVLGLSAGYFRKKHGITIGFGTEEQHFANFYTGYDLVPSMVERQENILKYYCPSISYSTTLWSKKRYSIFAEFGIGLKVNHHLYYKKTFHSGRVFARVDDLPNNPIKLNLDQCIIYQWQYGRFLAGYKFGLSSGFVNLYSEGEIARNSSNFNSRVSFVNQVNIGFDINRN